AAAAGGLLGASGVAAGLFGSLARLRYGLPGLVDELLGRRLGGGGDVDGIDELARFLRSLLSAAGGRPAGAEGAFELAQDVLEALLDLALEAFAAGDCGLSAAGCFLHCLAGFVANAGSCLIYGVTDRFRGTLGLIGGVAGGFSHV